MYVFLENPEFLDRYAVLGRAFDIRRYRYVDISKGKEKCSQLKLRALKEDGGMRCHAGRDAANIGGYYGRAIRLPEMEERKPRPM